MNRRGAATVIALSFSLAAGMGIGAFLSGWGWVDVRTTGEDAVHIALPVPMDLLPMACWLVPNQAIQDKGFQEFLRHKDAAIRVLDALRDCPNACLVKVESPDANVEITKAGDHLRIAVDAPDAHIRVRMPLSPMVRALKALGDAPPTTA
jgi:hypothetical protein